MSFYSQRALVAHLKADVFVQANVDTYKGEPAVFTAVPERAPDRYVAVQPAYALVDASTKNGSAYSMLAHFDLLCVSSRGRSIAQVENLAHYVRRAIHRATIAGSGPATIESAEALGGIGADTNEYFGRIVETRLLVREAT